MATLIQLKKMNTLKVTHADAVSAGQGHKKVTVELFNGKETKPFSALTHNMQGYDEAMDTEGQAKYEALYDLIASKIEDQISEWLQTI